MGWKISVFLVVYISMAVIPKETDSNFREQYEWIEVLDSWATVVSCKWDFMLSCAPRFISITVHFKCTDVLKPLNRK